MRRLLAWSLGALALLLFAVVSFWHTTPPLTGVQRFELILPDAPAGTSEPLLVTGKVKAGDFFYVKFLGQRQVVFGYDSWGQGGPVSEPVTFTPGLPQTLTVEMPSLARTPGSIDAIWNELHVTFNGQEIFALPVPFFSRRSTQLWFGTNPLGGTLCGPEFHGQLLKASDLRPLHGRVTETMTWGERFTGWIWAARGQLVLLILLLVCVVKLWIRYGDSPLTHLRAGARAILSALSTHRVFAITAATCTVAFAAMLTNGRFNLLYPESFGDFYDYQAASFLQGRLDVPYDALQGESFIYDGKIYGYFGPTPTLLRLPFVALGLGFGHLARPTMLLYYILTLVGAYLVLREVMRWLRPLRPEPARWEIFLFTLHLGLGSTVFFLASRAYTYHEAIICGIMLAVWSCWYSLRWLTAPTSRGWIVPLVLGVLALHARPPAGLFALVFLTCCAWVPVAAALRERRPPPLRRPLQIAVWAGLGVVSFNALSYAKFRTIEGCPLRLNVQYDAQRLAKIDGKEFHLSNLHYGLDTYFFNPSLFVQPHFPWLYLPPSTLPGKYPGAKIDLADRSASFPVGMTGLFLLSSIGCAFAAWRNPTALYPVLALWLAAVPLTLAMCAAIATAERYTGDFVPFFICAGAVGLTDLRWQKAGRYVLMIATLWGCLFTFAMTLHYQGALVWGVPDDVQPRYRQLRNRVDHFFGVPPSP